MITAEGIDMLESYIKSVVDHVEVRVGEEWYKAAGTEVDIVTEEDKVVILGSIPKAVAAGATIEEVRIIAVNGKTFSRKEVEIQRSAVSTGIMYSCEIFITSSEIIDD